MGFSVDDEDLADLITVGDAVDYVVARLGAAASERRASASDDARSRLEAALGHTFADIATPRRCARAPLVLRRAPRRAARTSGSSSSATRCSGLSVTDHIFDAYPELPEGELAKLRASVVNAEVLAAVADELDLGERLFLGKGEDASGGARSRRSSPMRWKP